MPDRWTNILQSGVLIPHTGPNCMARCQHVWFVVNVYLVTVSAVLCVRCLREISVWYESCERGMMTEKTMTMAWLMNPGMNGFSHQVTHESTLNTCTFQGSKQHRPKAAYLSVCFYTCMENSWCICLCEFVHYDVIHVSVHGLYVPVCLTLPRSRL